MPGIVNSVKKKKFMAKEVLGSRHEVNAVV